MMMMMMMMLCRFIRSLEKTCEKTIDKNSVMLPEAIRRGCEQLKENLLVEKRFYLCTGG